MTMCPKLDHEPTEKVRITVSSVAIRAPENRQTAARLRVVWFRMGIGLLSRDGIQPPLGRIAGPPGSDYR